MKLETISQSASRIVGIKAVFQHRVVGVTVGVLCGRVMPRAQNPKAEAFGAFSLMDFDKLLEKADAKNAAGFFTVTTGSTTRDF
jgi:hypothetical protein